MRGELMWVGRVSGSTLLQGTSVMMSVFIFYGTSGRGYGQCKWFHPHPGAILNTKATATFMFLPASYKLMMTNPYSKLLTASAVLTRIFAASLGSFQKVNSPTTIPNPGPAKK
eukprot:524627-Pelagomonas_calceolata.AAC.1